MVHLSITVHNTVKKKNIHSTYLYSMSLCFSPMTMAKGVPSVDSPLPLNRQDMHLKYQLSIGWDCVNRQGKCFTTYIIHKELFVTVDSLYYANIIQCSEVYMLRNLP